MSHSYRSHYPGDDPGYSFVGSDQGEVYSEADDTYLPMDGINEFIQPREPGRMPQNISLHLDSVLHQSQDRQCPSPIPPRRPHLGLNDWQHERSSVSHELPLERSQMRPVVQPRRHSAVPNYSKWDPQKKAMPFPALPPKGPPQIPDGFFPHSHSHLPPTMPPGPPPGPPDGPAFSDPQEEYLVFDKPQPQPPPYQAPKPKERYPAAYDDHTLPSRPPPLPPSSRVGSAKSDPGHSPVTSRPPSLKDNYPPMHSHQLERKLNKSTDSASSTSSEDLTQIPRGTTNKFMPFKPPHVTSGFPSKKPGSLSNTNMSMPSFHDSSPTSQSPSKGLATDFSKPAEEQPWFLNASRDGAQKAIEANKQTGVFIVRPRGESDSQPYALTVWVKGGFKNLVIRKKSNGEYALGKEKPGELTFKTVVKLIDYFQRNDLNLAESDPVILTTGP